MRLRHLTTPSVVLRAPDRADGSQNSIADAVSANAVRATMELEDGTLRSLFVADSTFADSTIDGGAGLGLDDATGAGEQASPVDLGAMDDQRMDDLLGAMSDAQCTWATVQAHIVNLGATDMVGALRCDGRVQHG